MGPAQKLVTEMGTYATQSALSSSRPAKKEEDRYLKFHTRPGVTCFFLSGILSHTDLVFETISWFEVLSQVDGV